MLMMMTTNSAMRDQYMRSGEGFVCMYDITSRQTFEELRSICAKVLEVQEEADVPMVIVGNKCDLDSKRQVETAEGQQMASYFHAQFYEASAKLGINVQESVYNLVRDIRQRRYSFGATLSSPRSSKWSCNLF
jgi:GTPase KRas protein